MARNGKLRFAAAAALAAALLAGACGSPAADPPAPAPSMDAQLQPIPPAPAVPPSAQPITPPPPAAPPAAESATVSQLEPPPINAQEPAEPPAPPPAATAVAETATRLFVELFGDSAAPAGEPSGVLFIVYEEAPSPYTAGAATIDGATLAVEGAPLAAAVAQSLADAGAAPPIHRVEVRAAGFDQRYLQHFGGDAPPNAYIVRAFGDLNWEQAAEALQALESVRYACRAYCAEPEPPPEPEMEPEEERAFDPPSMQQPYIRPPDPEPEPTEVTLRHNTIRVREGAFEWALVRPFDISDNDAALLKLRKTGGPNDDDIDINVAEWRPGSSRSHNSRQFVVWGRRNGPDQPGVETAELELVSRDPSRVRVTGNPTLTVEIVDEATPYLWMDWDHNCGYPCRGGETLSITVRAYPPPTQGLNFSVQLTKGNPSHFTGLPADATLAAGQTEVTVDSIAVRQIGINQGMEHFKLELKLNGDSRGRALISCRDYCGGDGQALNGTVAGQAPAPPERTLSPDKLPLEVGLLNQAFSAVEGGSLRSQDGRVARNEIPFIVSGEGPLLDSDPEVKALLDLLRIEGAPEEEFWLSGRPRRPCCNTSGREFEFSLYAKSDNLDEPQEQFQITLVSSDTATVRVMPEASSATVTVTDSNVVALWLSPDAVYDSGTVALTVGSQIVPNKDVPLVLELAEGVSATAATIPKTWTLPAGQTTTTISVGIIAPGETLTFRLTLLDPMSKTRPRGEQVRLLSAPWSDPREDLKFRLTIKDSGAERTAHIEPAGTPGIVDAYHGLELIYDGHTEHAPLQEWSVAFLDTATQQYTGHPAAAKIVQELTPILSVLDLQIARLGVRSSGGSFSHRVFVYFTTPITYSIFSYLSYLHNIYPLDPLPEGQPPFETIPSGGVGGAASATN